MRLLLITLCVLWSCQTGLSQLPENEVLGYPELSYFDLSTAGSHPSYTMKVYFNITRKDDGTGGYDPTRIPFITQLLDDAYNPLGINFEYVCDDIYLDNTERATYGARNASWCEWFQPQIPRHPDGIDIFIVTGLDAGNFKAKVSSIPGKFIVLNGGVGSVENQNEKIESNSVIHEFGHLFGLMHMYHGSTQNESIWPDLFDNECSDLYGDTGCGREFTCPYSGHYFNCVSQSYIVDPKECAEDSTNGDVAGDYIPDTPPSHAYAEDNALTNCEYVITVIHNDPQGKPLAPIILDPEGNNYNPDVTNYMSITPNKSCRDHFTPNQVTVMKNHIQSHPVLTGAHSVDGPILCDCDYEKIIYLRHPTNWSSVITDQNISPNELSDYEIVVESDLTIDTDYTFKNIDFTFTNDATLTIDSEVKIIKNDDGRSILSACQAPWEGVKVLAGASLELTGVDIYLAKNAVWAKADSRLSISDVVILGGNSWTTYSKGIYTEQNVDLVKAERIKIRDYHTGIQCKNSNGFYNFEFGEIGDCLIGFSLSYAPARIFDFDVVVRNTAISCANSPGMLIEANYLNGDPSVDSKGIDMWWSNGSVIKKNTIGASWQAPMTGISLFSSFAGAITEMNRIYGSRTGIFAFNTDFKIDQNEVTVNSAIHLNRGAIQLMYSTKAQIKNNFINADKVSFGINSMLSNLTMIENNEVTTNFFSNLHRTGGIRSEGGMTETIAKNIITTTGNSHGIIINNSIDNIYDCNNVRAMGDGNALEVLFNSEGHVVRANDLSGKLDLHLRSMLGEQVHMGNKFLTGNCKALNTDIAYDSKFFVNSTYQYHMPSNPDPSIGWFEDELDIHNFYSCTSSQGPDWDPFWNNNIVICEYYQSIINDYGSNSPEHIRFIQNIIRYARYNASFSLPQCISEDPSWLACWDKLAKYDKKLQRVFSKWKKPERVALFGHMVNLSRAYEQGQGASYLSQNMEAIVTLSNAITSDLSKINNEISIIKNKLETLDCNDFISDVAVAILYDYAQALLVEDRANYDYSNAINLSRYCADEYGPYIHLARAMAYQHSNEEFELYDDCLDQNLIPRSSKEEVIVTKASIFPNPGNGMLTIQFEKDVSASILVTTVTGKQLMRQELKEQDQSVLDLQSFDDSLYFIKVRHKNGNVEVFKYVVVK